MNFFVIFKDAFWSIVWVSFFLVTLFPLEDINSQWVFNGARASRTNLGIFEKYLAVTVLCAFITAIVWKWRIVWKPLFFL